MGHANVLAVQRILVVTDRLARQFQADAFPAFFDDLGHILLAASPERDDGGRVALPSPVGHFGRFLVFVGVQGWNLGDDLSAGHVDVARDGHERQAAVAGLVAVLVLVEREAPGNGGRFGGGVQDVYKRQEARGRNYWSSLLNFSQISCMSVS